MKISSNQGIHYYIQLPVDVKNSTALPNWIVTAEQINPNDLELEEWQTKMDYIAQHLKVTTEKYADRYIVRNDWIELSQKEWKVMQEKGIVIGSLEEQEGKRVEKSVYEKMRPTLDHLCEERETAQYKQKLPKKK